MSDNPTGGYPRDVENPDEWKAFLTRYVDNRATNEVHDGIGLLALHIVDAIHEATKTREMFGGTFHAFEQWLATRPDLTNAGTAKQLNEWHIDNLTAALMALAQYNIPPDVQELLIHGNPDQNVPPGALQAALKAAKP